MENKDMQNLEAELETSKKEKAKSLLKSVGMGTFPIATAAGLYFLDNVINSNIDKTVLARIADYVNNNLPLINLTVNGLERIRDYLFVGLTIGTLKQTGAMAYWYKTIEDLFNNTKKYARKVKWARRKLDNNKEKALIQLEGDTNFGYDHDSFENINAYNMLARANDLAYYFSGKTLSPEERRKIPQWKDSFLKIADSSKDLSGIVTENTAGEALRKVLLSRGIID